MNKMLSAVLALFPVATFAHDYQVGDLVILHPIAFETPKTAQSGVGYLSIRNDGETDDRLIGIEADFPRVMMHESVMTDDIATMAHREAITVPAGESISLEPGGMHLMFMGLGGDPFEVGEEFTAKLIFEKAGEIDVVFKVEARSADDEDVDHSGH